MENIPKYIKIDKRGFVKPNYHGYSIYNIPNSILKIFGIKSREESLSKGLHPKGQYENVILMVIDGMGYKRLMEIRKNSKIIEDFLKNVSIKPITSVFPSTTSAAITSLATGLTPIQHGIPEFIFYCKQIDSLFYPLLYSPIGVTSAKDVYLLSPLPEEIFPAKNIFTKLNEHGIQSFSFLEGNISNSVYSKNVFNGSKIIAYSDLADMVVRMKKILKNIKGRKFIYAYTSIIDTISHIHGIYSDEYYDSLENLIYILNEHFIKKLDKRTLNNTLILITADHGLIDINPKKVIYLNRKIEKYMKKDSLGKPIGVGGSPRDVFVYVDNRKLKLMENLLNKNIGEKALIIKSKKLIKEGMFGDKKPKKSFIDRFGDIIILPYGKNAIWYKNFSGDNIPYKALHGGLSEYEMLVPLIYVNQ